MVASLRVSRWASRCRNRELPNARLPQDASRQTRRSSRRRGPRHLALVRMRFSDADKVEGRVTHRQHAEHDWQVRAARLEARRQMEPDPPSGLTNARGARRSRTPILLIALTRAGKQ